MRQWFSLVLLGCALVVGCGGPLRYQVAGLDKASGADALIVANVDSGAALTRLTVSVEHLPPPDRIDAGGTAFVVWARPNDGAPWQRIGSLVYDADSRKGELTEASVPQTNFDLVVSAEKQAAPGAPSGAVVVKQRVAK